MDKDMAKKIFSYEGINQVPHITCYSYEQAQEIVSRAEANLGYPCFIKPANMGSSVGISKAKDKQQLVLAMQKAFEYDHKIIIEKGVNAREIEVAVLGNCDNIRISVAGEIIPSDEFYDYDAKYKSNASQLIIPADLSFEADRQIQDMAYRAYKGLNAEGLCRIDFFVDKDTQKVYLNEVNSMPGFTSISMYPKLWENSGVSYEDLLEELIDLAIQRHKRDSSKKNM
jgi:D-alanine-D-alanine ligase